MSMDDFTTCLRGQYNLDEEAVVFIVTAIETGGEDLLKWFKDHWTQITAAGTVLGWIAKYGARSAVVKYVTTLLERLGLSGEAVGAAFVDAFVAVLLGLAFGAILLAIEAGIECAPRIQN